MSTRTLRKTRQSSSSQAVSEKENAVKLNGVSRSKAASKSSQVCVSCRQSDDGSPMIHCSECKEWYHFKCLQLDSREAEDIQLYVCAPCTEKTGLRTVMEWEGPEAVEELSNGHINPVLLINPVTTKVIATHEEPDESSDDGSEDEYVEESGRKKGKRRAHPPSSDSEDVSDSGRKPKSTAKNPRRPSALTIKTVRRSTSGSPGPNSPALKRRKSTVSHEPSSKRKRSESLATPGAGADAARKYCSTKLQEIFVDIFLNYPVLEEPSEDQDELVVMKKREDLTPEEKEKLEEKGRRFATELEECVFDTYSEPDPKTGHHIVGMKYKERFRMLTFNLSKSDRVMLHQRIAALHITPKELSTMSSTDLADEETKKSIKQAEKEALAQTILKKTSLPTAKMTHKGMQDIEDDNGALSRERQREREEEEEQRIERERLERVRLQAQRAAAQGSMPPESPTTPSMASWGAPPPVPLHALDGSSISPSSSRPSLNPLFIHTSSDMVTSPIEQELNLADLINIDDEPGQELSISLADPAIPPISESAPTQPDSAGGDQTTNASQSPTPVSATGISPFASRSSHPDFTPRPSFDLNAIWSNSSESVPSTTQNDNTDTIMEEGPAQPERAGSPVPAESGGAGTNDQDFDMFLQGDGEPADEGEDMEESTPQPPTPEDIQAAFEAAPRVWSGKIGMPLDSGLPQEVSVSARQIGGRTLGGDSLLWRTLFPTDHLRIDGRVPVDKSAEFLTQIRLNPHKELIAAAFAPDSQESSESFATLSKFLISKNRHGLVFPWGNRPKEHHPGRELYIVPLKSSDPLPEFIELLDGLKLPQTRNTDYMIGIWILNKGKLAPPPGMTMPPVPPPSSISPPAASVPPVPQPTDGSVPAPPSGPPAILASLPPSLVPPGGQLPPNVSAEALAAEVASLTPDQIQLMLQALATSGQQPPSTMLAPPPVPPAPQPWMAGPSPSPYPPYGPPPPGIPPLPYAQPPPPLSPPQGYGFSPDRPPYPPHQSGGGPPYDSYSRGGDRGGYRGRNNRNKDRDRGGGGQDRPRDSGWRGRGRGRGRGGGGGGGGGDRGKQWNGPPPQQW